ncbi:MAG TPA: hypothetical protein VHQ20_00960 [Patescibacteria group bacterium]|jgi:hypothetical protein|nr:hypothetical protein [Patescibacteria group bacterium]
MSTKTLSLASFIPQISSTTKTAKVTANGSETMNVRRASKTASAPVRRSVSANSWISAITAISLTLAVVGLASYIYETNASVSKSYEYKQEQAKVNDLSETQKRLVVQEAALGSIVKVNDVASTAGMVPVTSEEFLSANQLSSR